MLIKIIHNYIEILEINSEYKNLDRKVWDELEKEFNFSIKNSRCEIVPDDNFDIETIIINLDSKGYTDFLFWKSRIDKIDFILKNT